MENLVALPRRGLCTVRFVSLGVSEGKVPCISGDDGAGTPATAD